MECMITSIVCLQLSSSSSTLQRAPQLKILKLASAMSSELNTQKARIELIAPTLRGLVQQHQLGLYPEGPEALNAHMTKLIKEAGLAEVKVSLVDRIGCFPGNRHGAMLVAVDVHSILSEGFATNGWNVSKWECMCLTIPESVQASWKQANIDLVNRSDGLLPDIVDMELATGRGSHGAAALRSIKFACTAIDPKVADEHGKVSLAKLLEKQPSLRDPIVNGVPVTVIPGELELAAPGVFAVLSEVGNASNSVYRLQTTLQTCVRIHALVKQSADPEEPNWSLIGKQASIGLSKSDSDQIDNLCKFVAKWSGGSDGHILQDLETYEKALTSRRKLRSSDLEKLANVNMDDIPLIVPVTWIKLEP